MVDRYSRQILFSSIGKSGQERLRQKHVAIVGIGALGTGIAETLTRAGVGKITIIDRDYIEPSNLQRQSLFSEEDAKNKLPKVIAAKKRLNEINSTVIIEEIVGEMNAELLNVQSIGWDLIIDGTDNFETRFLLNDVAHKHNIPLIFGSCVGSFGASFTIIPGKTPCLNCILKRIPMQGQTCDTVGIIAPTVQMVTAHQCTEALKILTDNMDVLRQTYVTFDLWENQHLSIKADALKDSNCLTCGSNRTFPFLSYESQTKTAILCGRETVQIRPSTTIALSIDELYTQWERSGYRVKRNPYLVSVQKENVRMVIFEDGRALIHGTSDIVKAKRLYHSLIG